MTIAGPTSCGKTTWLKKVLQHGLITPAPEKITWCYREWQPLYTEMVQTIANMTFVEGLQVPEMDGAVRHVIVLDDLMTDVTKNKEVSNLFTVGSHHRNTSVICLLQNLFYQGKENRTMNLNSQYLVLFKNPRDRLQISCLARQMYPRDTSRFMDRFEKVTAQPYGCLVVDLKQETPERERLKAGNATTTTTEFRPQLQGSGTESMNGPPGIPAYPDREEVSVGGDPYQAQAQRAIKEQTWAGRSHLQGGSLAVKMAESTTTTAPTPSPTMSTADSSNNSSSSMGEKVTTTTTPMTSRSTTPCIHCGVIFQTPHHLQMHLQRRCAMQADEEEGEDSDEDGDHPWNPFIQQAFNRHNKEFRERVESHMKSGAGEKEARQKAAQELRPKYRRSLQHVYMNFLDQMHTLAKSSHHREIMQDIDWNVGWRGYSFEKALSRTLRKKRHIFGEMIEEQLDETDDDNDDDDDDDDDDDAGEKGGKKEVRALQQYAMDQDEDDLPLSELAKRL